MNFTEKSFLSFHKDGEADGQHRLYYSDWGDEKDHPVICIHGLTGNGHDFDVLASDLIQHGYRVIAPDLPGRGRSDFFTNPLLYNYDQYMNDLHELLARLNLQAPGSVDWIGVSLGGLLGMRMAAMDNSPIKRLVINDVGPVVPQEALDFILKVVSKPYAFDTIADLEKRMRSTRGLSWGPISEEQWALMAKHNARALEDGRITYSYDPNIAVVFKNAPTGDVDLWRCWDAISCPVMLIQGKDSIILTPQIIEKMGGRGPNFDLTVFEGCGHVPSLMADNQVEILRDWLNKK